MRSFRLLSFLSCGVVALAAAPLWAQNVEEKGVKAGMPQLDMAFYPGQIFWLVVAFAILYLLMKVALPGVQKTQTKRSKAIAEELAAASTANDEAKKIIAEYEKALADAKTQAQVAVTDITRQAAIKSMERQTEQQQALNKTLHEAEVRIASAREAALRDAEATVSEIASAAIEKIAGVKLKASA